MKALEHLRMALDSILSHKLRAFLTTLGIIIGVGAVISLVAVANGIRREVTTIFQEIGASLILVVPGTPEGQGGFGGLAVASTLTLDDLRAIQQQPDIAAAAAVTSVVARVRTEGRTLDTFAIGATPALAQVSPIKMAQGRFIQGDTDAALRPGTARELFGEGNALGKTLTVAGKTYTVVGVIEPPQVPLNGGPAGGDNGPLSFQNGVYLPVEDTMALVNARTVGQLFVRARSPEVVDQATAEIQSVLRERHGIQDFDVESQQDFLGFFNRIADILTVALSAIAGISLVVGGIGIMNIMLVSVAERTREIGIRKAVGAKDGDVLAQFLVEAVSVSLLGGALGVVVAFAVTLGLETFLDLPTAITAGSVALAFGVSALIGVIFGVAPAVRAARLDPIAALRHE